METFSYLPDYGADSEKKFDVQKVRFGDGYEQRFVKGMNAEQSSWTLPFNNRDAAEWQAIEAFLQARGGTEAFLWTPPLYSSPIVVVCESWRPAPQKGGRMSIVATFVRVYEP